MPQDTASRFLLVEDEPMVAMLVEGYCQVGAGSGLWQGLGHEHDVQSVPRLPLSG